MLRVREKSNSWPSFVDLFSNLVIILIFLLIVFVFLWTTTTVFRKGGVADTSKLTELKKITAEQSVTIDELRANEEQAKELLIAARSELLALDDRRAILESERAALESQNAEEMAERNRMTQEQLEIVAAYEKKLYDMTGTVDRLSAELNIQRQTAATSREMTERAAALQTEIERMNTALAAAEQQRASKEVEYAALSEQLNKALADKASELGQLSKYQSQFFGAVRDALAGMGGVDVSSDRFVISSDILFPVGGFLLSSDGKKQIKIVADVIRGMETKIPANVNWVIRVDGHTDRLPVRKGAKLYKTNLDLSLLRAKEVVRELLKDGVLERRLVPAGFGEDYPIVEGKTAKDLQKNRRIELRLTNQ